MDNQLKVYSKHAIGLGKLLQNSDLQIVFRSFKKV